MRGLCTPISLGANVPPERGGNVEPHRDFRNLADDGPFPIRYPDTRHGNTQAFRDAFPGQHHPFQPHPVGTILRTEGGLEIVF